MGIADRKKREKELRRTEILNAAERLFFSRGYDDVSMDEIAHDVELNKATIYLYFRNKRALFYAVVRRGLRIWYDMICASEQDACNGIDKLAAIGLVNRRFVKEYPHYYRSYNFFRSGRFDTEKMTDNDDVKEIREILQGFSTVTDTAIMIGIEDGTIRSDIDPAVLAVLLMTVSDSVNNLNPQFRKKLESRGIDQDRFYNEFVGMIYNMIENPEKKVRRRI